MDKEKYLEPKIFRIFTILPQWNQHRRFQKTRSRSLGPCSRRSNLVALHISDDLRGLNFRNPKRCIGR